VPFHDAPTYAMRLVHESRGIRYGSSSRRSASDGAILASGLASLGGIAVQGDAADSPPEFSCGAAGVH
jgi:hypothetical protein